MRELGGGGSPRVPIQAAKILWSMCGLKEFPDTQYLRREEFIENKEVQGAAKHSGLTSRPETDPLWPSGQFL